MRYGEVNRVLPGTFVYLATVSVLLLSSASESPSAESSLLLFVLDGLIVVSFFKKK